MKLAQIQAALKAPKGQFNSFGKYKYRSTEDIVEAVKPLLVEHGFALIMKDDIVLIGDRYYVKSMVAIVGEDAPGTESPVWCATAFAREEAEKKGMDGAQITGAASSYARKYALNGLFAIDDAKDADTDENRHIMDRQEQREREAEKVKLLPSVESFRGIFKDEPVTEQNYGDVICHIGKAGGEMKGKKVSEIDPNLLDWLVKEWRVKWGKKQTPEDLRLTVAVNYALNRLPATLPPPEPETQPTGTEEPGKDNLSGGLTAVQPLAVEARPIADAAQVGKFNKDMLVVEILKKAEKLGLHEAGLCALLRKQGIFEKWFALRSAKLSILQYVYGDGWKIVEDLVKEEAAK